MTGTTRACLGHPTRCAASGVKRHLHHCMVGATRRTGVKTRRAACVSSLSTTPLTKCPTSNISSSSSTHRAPPSCHWCCWFTFRCSCQSYRVICTVDASVTVVVHSFTLSISSVSSQSAVNLTPRPLDPGGGVSLCGDPRWGAEFDDGFQTEQREPWSSNGNLPSTMSFLEAVRSCPSLVRPRWSSLWWLGGHEKQC